MRYKDFMMKDVRDLILERGAPIVLVGMMGTGKTHFGRLLSQALRLEYYDTDSLVEAKAGCSIAEIFDRWGEESFRRVEAKTIQEHLQRPVRDLDRWRCDYEP